MSLDTKFTPASATAKVPIGPTFIEFLDQSGCHIDVFLAVQGNTPAHARFVAGQTGGAAKLPYTFTKAGPVRCSFSVFANTQGTFSRIVDVTVKVNGKKFATVTGQVPKDPGFDDGGDLFTLDVS